MQSMRTVPETPMKCRAVVQPSGDACGKPATIKTTFADGDTTLMCQRCALNMQETAPGSIVKTEKL